MRHSTLQLVIMMLWLRGLSAMAQTATEPVETEAASEPRPAVNYDSRYNRSMRQLTVSVIPLSFGWVLPTKHGLSATWLWDETWSFEAEYLRARYGIGFLGVDIGNLAEEHRSLNALYYLGNSFYFKSGLTRRSYAASFGSEYLSRITGTELLSGAEVRIANETLNFGLGNRWLFDSGVSLGMEWFDLMFAVGKGEVTQSFMNQVKDVGEQHELGRLFNYFRYGTTFQTFKLSIGYTF